MSAPEVERMAVRTVFETWRPGSHAWGWAEEYADIMAQEKTPHIRARVDAEGIGFQDHIAPILLGSDGRVWDGHHRLCLARERGLATVMVERA